MKKGGVIHDYIKKMKNIQKHILQFLDDDSNQEENYQILISYIIDLKIIDNKKEIKEILNLILHISNNYHHSPIFFSQIDRILAFFKNEIQDCFSNFDLFHFFRKNKRILLFLFEEKILIPDRTIYRYILNNDKCKRRNYLQYFYPEFKTFFSQKTIPRLCKDDNELFKQKRKAGENDKYICNLIRNDDVDEFVTYVNRTNLPLSLAKSTRKMLTKLLTVNRIACGAIDYMVFLWVRVPPRAPKAKRQPIQNRLSFCLS